jgi:hypothetical protein
MRFDVWSLVALVLKMCFVEEKREAGWFDGKEESEEDQAGRGLRDGQT